MLLENSSFPEDARVRHEAVTLVRAGYEVTVICPASAGQRRQSVESGVRVLRFRLPAERQGTLGFFLEYGVALFWFMLLSAEAAIRWRFDIIHTHNPPDLMVLVALVYKPFGVRFVFDHHDLSPEMYDARFRDRARSSLRGVLVWFERLSFRFADLVIATNESYRDIAIGRGRVDPDHVSVVRNGPDLGRVYPRDPDALLATRAGTILGYVGAMANQDGVDYLIRSLLHLRRLGENDFLAVIVGRGPALSTLSALVGELGLEQHVWFTGYVSDESLMRILSTADICVVPDPRNPFVERSTMIKVMEYMALEKPIVAFDMTEHRRSAGEAALYADANDERDFARKIQILIHDREMRRSMGRLGRQRVEEELAWQFQEPDLLDAYRRLGARAS